MEYVPIRAFLFVQLINKSLREADYKHTPEMQLEKSKNPQSSQASKKQGYYSQLELKSKVKPVWKEHLSKLK